MQLSRQGSVNRRVASTADLLEETEVLKQCRVEAAGRCRARGPRIRRRGPAAAKAVLSRLPPMDDMTGTRCDMPNSFAGSLLWLPSYMEEEQEAEQESRYAPAG